MGMDDFERPSAPSMGFAGGSAIYYSQPPGA
jgi:hypothetical protein